MNSTLRINEPSEILSLIPFQLGFTPHSSAVVVSLRGPNRRVGLVARVDLCDLDADHSDEVVTDLVAHCASDGATGVVLVAYANNDQPAALAASLRAIKRLADGFHGTVNVEETLAVYDGKFGHYSILGECLTRPASDLVVNDSLHNDLCRRHSGRTDLLRNSMVSARMVFEGRVPAPSRAALALIEPSGKNTRASAARSYRKARERQAAQQGNSTWRESALTEWLRLLSAPEGAEIPPKATGRLAAMFQDVPLRDAVLVSCTSLGTEHAKQFVHLYSKQAGTGEQMEAIARAAIAEITDANAARKPDLERVLKARRILSQVIADNPAPLHAPARTLLALLAWWEGHGALARRHLEEANLLDGSYSLAQLVLTALNYGLAPGWQRRPE